MTDVPERYQPEPRLTKAELYEMYWGEKLLSAEEIASQHDFSKAIVTKLMKQYGIPKRPAGWNRDTTTSPVVGFYNGDEVTKGGGSQVEHKWETSQEFAKATDWQKYAKNNDHISDRAIIQ